MSMGGTDAPPPNRGVHNIAHLYQRRVPMLGMVVFYG